LAVADGGYTYGDEEEIVFVLQPGVGYSLQLLMWRWSQDVPDCPTFNMQIAVGPLHPLPAVNL
jgi:hypothetical protein